MGFLTLPVMLCYQGAVGPPLYVSAVDDMINTFYLTSMDRRDAFGTYGNWKKEADEG